MFIHLPRVVTSVNPVLGTTFRSHGLEPKIIAELASLGLYYVVDGTWPGALFLLSEATQTVVCDLLKKFNWPKIKWDWSDDPDTRDVLGLHLPWVVLQQHSLHEPLRRKLRDLTQVSNEAVIGSPTPLALALLPKMRMQPAMHKQLNMLLKRYGLKQRMPLQKMFVLSSRPALTNGQAMILSTNVYNMGLDEETLMWVLERMPPVPQAIDALVAMLAVTDAPEQLREWFAHRNLPTNRLTADDLSLAMRTAHTEG